MKKTLIALLSLTSISAFAGGIQIEYPNISEKLFRANSSADAICKHYGYSRSLSKKTSDGRLIVYVSGAVDSIVNLIQTGSARGISGDNSFDYELDENLIYINRKGEIQDLPYLEKHRFVESVNCKN